MKKLIFILILILNSYSIFSQVKVYLKNNKKYEGIKIYESQDSMKLLKLNGEENLIEKNRFNIY